MGARENREDYYSCMDNWTNWNKVRTDGVKNPSQLLVHGALDYLLEY